jgi:membrane-associated phospholipid phosphatase
VWVGYAQNWTWLDTVDTQLLQTFHNLGATHPGWVSFWVVFCTVFGPNGFRVIALVLVIVALVRRAVATALFLVISIGLMGLVTEGAKFIAGRPRPATALAYGSSTSFPSGHALGVMVGMLVLLTVLWPALTADCGWHWPLSAEC